MFTDKTGTLTENEMKFRQCSINGVKYVEVKGQLQPQKEGEAEEEVSEVEFIQLSVYLRLYIIVIYSRKDIKILATFLELGAVH